MPKVKVCSLVLDHNLYPRTDINSHNVQSLVDALQAGATLPPIIADKGSRQVIDGFHRVRAAQKVGGESALIDVVWRQYKTDGDRFLDAMKYNSNHGQRLSSFDAARCVLLAEELKLEPVQVASALQMTPERLSHLVMRKTAIDPDEKMVPIKHTLSHKAGQQLTRKQMKGNEVATGLPQLLYVNQVLNLFENDVLDVERSELIDRLGKLHSWLHKKGLVKKV